MRKKNQINSETKKDSIGQIFGCVGKKWEGGWGGGGGRRYFWHSVLSKYQDSDLNRKGVGGRATGVEADETRERGTGQAVSRNVQLTPYLFSDAQAFGSSSHSKFFPHLEPPNRYTENLNTQKEKKKRKRKKKKENSLFVISLSEQNISSRYLKRG